VVAALPLSNGNDLASHRRPGCLGQHLPLRETRCPRTTSYVVLRTTYGLGNLQCRPLPSTVTQRIAMSR
jgi:hypothetical protein